MFHDYLELCKPKVVAMMLLTVLVGMYLATSSPLPVLQVLLTLLGIGASASAAATINHIVDQKIDLTMQRTQLRPLVRGAIKTSHAMVFAAVLAIFGIVILAVFINILTAFLTFLTVIGYAGIYTGYLKRATSQNIVIGGLAGAAPPLLGWSAVTNNVSPEALVLVLIIFLWTPPHFWALALYRLDEYKMAKLPMLPVTHGPWYTKLNILLYSILLCTSTYLPFAIEMSGKIYLFGITILNMMFLYRAIKLFRGGEVINSKDAIQLFVYSIVYLFALFILLLLDKYWMF
jgi:heme o synthase